MKHVAWRLSPDDPEIDGERLTAAEMGLRMPGHDVEMEARTELSFHRVQIKKSDFEKMGVTTSCQGCKSILRLRVGSHGGLPLQDGVRTEE